MTRVDESRLRAQATGNPSQGRDRIMIRRLEAGRRRPKSDRPTIAAARDLNLPVPAAGRLHPQTHTTGVSRNSSVAPTVPRTRLTIAYR
jgi:hypothetical protein